MADPHVISALKAKRAELSGELISVEKRILQLREDISSLDRTIRVFDPTAELHTIRPILRRKKPTLIPRGQCSRAILDMLRHADDPLTAREIASQLAARYQMDASNTDAMKPLIAKVRNTLSRQNGPRERDAGRRKGLEGGERGLAPRPPFAILGMSSHARSEFSWTKRRSSSSRSGCLVRSASKRQRKRSDG